MTIAIGIMGLNLRPALITIGPLLPMIGHALALNTPAIAVVSALPILIFGAVSPFAYRLAEKTGLNVALLGAALGIAIGILWRSSATVSGLIVGTLLLAAGIGLGNTLLPVLVKSQFPHAVGRVMGVYTTMLTLGAAAGALGTPLFLPVFAGDWRATLAVWALPAAFAALLWLLLARDAPRTEATTGGVSPWRSRTGWNVSIFMGCQAMIFYTIVTWLSVLLQTRGMSLIDTGYITGIFFAGQVVASMIGPIILVRSSNQGALVTGFMLVTVIATCSCLFVPLWAVWIGAAVGGLALGPIFGFALVFIVSRAREVGTSSRLSGMAQCVGYLLAGVGPFVLGLIHTRPDAMTDAAIWFCVMGVGAIISGNLAGRPRFVEDDFPEPVI